MPDQGDIVLVPVPFTDLSSNKRRPVIVISNDRYNRRTADLIVVAMTSTSDGGGFGFPLTTADLDAGRMNRPGTVRVDKIYTLAQSIVVKRFGRVNATILDRIRQLLSEIVKSTP